MSDTVRYLLSTTFFHISAIMICLLPKYNGSSRKIDKEIPL